MVLIVAAMVIYTAFFNQSDCDDQATWGFKDSVITNDIWNKGQRQGRQCVTADGWNWDWPNGGSDVISFPHVEYGFSSWQQESTTPVLPRQVRQIKRVNVNFKHLVSASGIGETTFMMWFNSEPAPTESNLIAQVMVWTENRGRSPSGADGPTIRADNRTFRQISTKTHGRDLVIFIPDRPLDGGELDLGIFVNALVAQHHLDPGSYLSDIDFGDEISSGRGTEKILKLDYLFN